MASRPLKISDFKDQHDCIVATYIGNSGFLRKGETYNVTLNIKSGRATVQQRYNPQMLHGNGGVQFPIHTFLIEEDDSMVNFSDLTPEDQENLLKQARQLVDEENIAKNAIAAFKMKKKEYTEDCLDEIYQAFNIVPGNGNKYNGRYMQQQHKNAVRTRYISMVNFLFKANVLGKDHATDNHVIINSFEWDRYIAVCDIVKEAMIKSYEFGKHTEV